MLPWSVMPSAGWPSATALATSSSRRAAPSSIENSVWTWRCVNESPTMRHISPRLCIDSTYTAVVRPEVSIALRTTVASELPSVAGRALTAQERPQRASLRGRNAQRYVPARSSGIWRVLAGSHARRRPHREVAGASARAAGGRRAAGRTASPGCRGTALRASRRAGPWRCGSRSRWAPCRRGRAAPATSAPPGGRETAPRTARRSERS